MSCLPKRDKLDPVQAPAIDFAVAFGLGLLVAVQAAAVTLHRSFRTQEVGIGGGASVLVPVEARVAKAIDEAQEKEAKRPKVAIGKVTKVCSGDLIHVLTAVAR